MNCLSENQYAFCTRVELMGYLQKCKGWGRKVVGKAILVHDQSVILVALTGF